MGPWFLTPCPLFPLLPPPLLSLPLLPRLHGRWFLALGGPWGVLMRWYAFGAGAGVPYVGEPDGFALAYRYVRTRIRAQIKRHIRRPFSTHIRTCMRPICGRARVVLVFGLPFPCLLLCTHGLFLVCVCVCGVGQVDAALLLYSRPLPCLQLPRIRVCAVSIHPLICYLGS